MNWNSLLAAIFTLLLLGATGCGEDSPATSDPGDADIVSNCNIAFDECEVDQHCANNMVCDQTTCQCIPSTGADGDISGDGPDSESPVTGNCNCAEHACISVAPRSVSFGTVRINESLLKNFQIRNDGSQPFNIVDIKLVKLNTALYPEDPNNDGTNEFRWDPDSRPELPIRLAPSESITIGVILQPEDAGKDEAQIDITTDILQCDMTKVSVFMESEYKGQTEICHNPDEIDFPSVQVGGEAVQQTVTLQAVRREPENNRVIEINAIEFDPPNPAGFYFQGGQQTLTNLAPLPPSGDLTFNVNFEPLQAEEYNVDVVIKHNSDYGCTTRDEEGNVVNGEVMSEDIRIPIRGKGVKPCLEVEPDPISFEGVTTGQTAEMDVRLRASAECGGAVQMCGCSFVDDNPEWEIFDPSDACNALIPAGQWVTFKVRFTPGYRGVFTNRLELCSNDADVETSIVIATGNGVEGALSCGVSMPSGNLNPNVSFGETLICDEETQSLTVKCVNTGSGNVRISGMSLNCEGDSFNMQNLNDNIFPIDISNTPGSNFREFIVEYDPCFDPSEFLPEDCGNFEEECTLNLHIENFTPPVHEVALSGTPVWPLCDISINDYPDFTGTLDFGEVPVNTCGSYNMRIINNGCYTCEFDPAPFFGPQSSSDFSIMPPIIPPVNPYGSYDVTVSYCPQLYPGPDSGDLKIPSNDLRETHSPYEIELQGQGVNPEIRIRPDTSSTVPYNFDEVLKSVCSDCEGEPLHVVIDNTGVGSLVVKSIEPARETIDGAFTIYNMDPPEIPDEGITLRPSSQHPEDTIEFDVVFCPMGFEAILNYTLRIQSTDPSNPVEYIYFRGEGTNCPANYFDLENDDDECGCGYFCYRPTPESQVPYEICDGYDNDCDGQTDEDFRVGQTCDGIGACGIGVHECAGRFETRCSTEPNGTDDESTVDLCDGRDNNCDGETDEDYMVGELCAGTGECDLGHWRCGTIEDPSDEYSRYCDANEQNLGVTDVCDGKDNDCDGETDEETYNIIGTDTSGPPDVCTDCVGRFCQGQGACEGGIWICGSAWEYPDLMWIQCSSEGGGEAEVCNGEDDDCDGLTDEGLASQGGKWLRRSDSQYYDIGEICDGAGACGQGVIQCNPENVMEVICSTDWGGEDFEFHQETCDSLDNDCDGETDEDWFIGGECLAIGECGMGEWECDPNGGRRCSTNIGGSDYAGQDELCDQLDNDCDGETDNPTGSGGATFNKPGTPCVGTGACGVGVWECASLTTTTCSADDDNDTLELCDGLDNDCDGVTDNIPNFPVIGSECNGEGECGLGVHECDGFNNYRCSTDFGGSQYAGENEQCDGLDNDCDGSTDEDYYVGNPCTGVGECGEGVYECNGLDDYQCSTDIGGSAYPSPPLEETCDGLDNDCDGEVDEGFEIEPPCGDVNNCGGCGTVCEVEHGVPACHPEECRCVIDECENGWHDVDGKFSTGCECQIDSYDQDGQGEGCGTAIRTSPFTLNDNDKKSITITGNISPRSDVDWYQFEAVDLPEDTPTDTAGGVNLYCNIYDVYVTFLSNPRGEFSFDVYEGSCDEIGHTTRICQNEISFDWSVRGQWQENQHGGGIEYKGQCPCHLKADVAGGHSQCEPNPDHMPEGEGESNPGKSCGCPGTDPDIEVCETINHCTDDEHTSNNRRTTRYYIKVYRNGGAEPTCSDYQLLISNGVPH